MTIGRSLGTTIIGLGFAGLAAASAVAGELRDQPKAVVELFTSQGCSSCPPADALLEEMAQRQDVIALAYHVDYWDYIGWPDTFGAKENSDHQRDYADSWKNSRIYTPQLIINGTEDVVGSREAEIEAALTGATLVLPVSLTVADDMLAVDIEGQAGVDDAMVWVVTFIDRADVLIERGENAGQTIAYSQVVTGRQVIGMWEAGAGTHVKLPLAEVLGADSNGLAIIVQQGADGMPGPIIGAASYMH
jgi:hypothetical protein